MADFIFELNAKYLAFQLGCVPKKSLGMSRKSSKIARMVLRRSAVLVALLLTACQSAFLNAPIPTAISLPGNAAQPSPTSSPTLQPTFPSTSTETPLPSPTPKPSATFTPSPTPLPAALSLDPADWENWPVLPIVPEHARQIFQIGQSLGNDMHAFSVFGDCQSEPDVFMGIYDTDPQLVAKLPFHLQETVAWFAGSFNRQSPTAKGGTTTGALLWSPWHQNKFTCTIYESPLQCELRIHKPAFVFVRVGTHYESHNQNYMRKVLDQLIAAGVVPILATKADNSELDRHVNSQYAQLAVEYNLPFWNFWAALIELPNHGLYTSPDVPNQGDIYLIDEAVAIQRMSALQALDRVRQAVMGP